MVDMMQQQVQQGPMLQESEAMCDLGKGCVAMNEKMLQYIAR